MRRSFLWGIMLFFSVAFLLSGLSASADEGLHPPSSTLEIYKFDLGGAEKLPKAPLFTFHPALPSYSLTWNSDGRKVCSEVLYVKTFGGRAPTVTVHLVNGRLLIYPETVANSQDAGSAVNAMMAITHVYDVKANKVIQSSEPYRYDHDIPLRYRMEELLHRLLLADLEADMALEEKETKKP